MDRIGIISVCMATYNGEKYIKEQISSILCQLGRDDELIISDDGSKDGTLNIITDFSDHRIKLFNNMNHGVNNNFENAITHATGDYIFLCDQDDIWKEGKVEVILKELQNHVMIVHNAQIIDGEGKQNGKTYYECTPNKTGFWGNLWKSRYLGCCMAFRSSLLKELLPFPKNVFGHDYWIGLYTDFRYNVKFIDDILISYRRHGGNVSTSGEQSTASIYNMFVEKRLRTLYQVLKRSYLGL